MNPAVLDLLARLAIDAVALTALLLGLHIHARPTREFVSSVALLHLTTFALTHLLSDATTSTGLGLGLFAVFGLLRYRTEALEMGQLTWMFVAIGVAVTNGFHAGDGFVERLVLASVLVGAAWVFALLRVTPPPTVDVTYDKLDLLTPARRDELLADLRQRAGLDAAAVTVGPIDLLKETARLTVALRTPDDAR
jgi:hypothetical protein